MRKADRYRAQVWKNGQAHVGPYQVVIEKARADLRLYRKKFTLPNPLALVGPLAKTEGPSGPFPEKWMHGSSDFIKVPLGISSAFSRSYLGAPSKHLSKI